jgi:hypothetical protein
VVATDELYYLTAGVPVDAEKQRNIKYFQDHLQEFLADPLKNGKFVVICEGKVQAVADTFETALGQAVARFRAEDFIVQQVIDESQQVNFLHGAL